MAAPLTDAVENRLAFLSELGLFLRPGFLDDALLAGLRGYATDPDGFVAGRVVRSAGEQVEAPIRRVRRRTIAEPLRAGVDACLNAVMPELAQHFDERLVGFEAPQFLLYQPGDGYGAHRDVLNLRRQPEGRGPRRPPGGVRRRLRQRPDAARRLRRGAADPPRRDPEPVGGLRCPSRSRRCPDYWWASRPRRSTRSSRSPADSG